MTVEEKMWKLVQGLHSKTSKGHIKWEQTAAKNSYQTAFPSYTVRISELPSQDSDTGPDYFISVFNEAGALVERASDVSILNAVKDSKPFSSMQELYTMARRSAMGVDAALDDLLSTLDVPF